jgi:hypothetical protein
LKGRKDTCACSYFSTGGVAAGERERARAICLPFIVITSAPATLKDTMSALRALVSEGRGRDGGCCAAAENRVSERERRESFPFCQRYIITTVRAVSYFSPFVFNLAVSASCILFAAAANADAHNASSFLSALCAICASRSCSSSHFRRGVKLVLQ